MTTLCHALDIVTLRAPEANFDTRYDYDNELVILALNKTLEKYGGYKVNYSQNMSFQRVKEEGKLNTYQNFITKLSYEKKNKEVYNLSPIPFPVDLGVVGYRICFTSKAFHNLNNQDLTLKKLKKFHHIQGEGWADSEILLKAGFKVLTTYSYSSMFKMIERGRIDLFCRGINEIYNEQNNLTNINKKIFVDKLFLLHYPLPRFFYTHSHNKRIIKRLTEGLLIAYKDGSLLNLWKQKYFKSIKWAFSVNRKLFSLQNQETQNINFEIKKYFYPIEKEFSKNLIYISE